MEAAREADKALLVLDRPNAIGGVEVEGPILEEGLRGNFIGYFALPTRHGLTLGELARLYNTEFKIGCRLDVVKMEGWTRSQYFDDTGLPWVNPSPNMRSLAAAIAYPGLGALEGTNLSVGRRSIEADLKAGKSPAEIERGWQADLEAFKAARKKVLLY